MSNVISFELKRFEKDVRRILSDNKIYYYENDNKPTLSLGLTNKELELLSKCNNEVVTVLEEYQENNYDYESHLLYCEQMMLYDRIEATLKNNAIFELNPNDFKWVVDCIEFSINENSISSNAIIPKKDLKALEEIYKKVLPKQNIILKTTKTNEMLPNMYKGY